MQAGVQFRICGFVLDKETVRSGSSPEGVVGAGSFAHAESHRHMWVAGLDGFDMPGQYRSGLGGVFPGLQDDGVRTRRHGGIHGGHDRFARHEVTVQMRVGPAQTAVFAVADTTVGKFDQTAGSDMIAQRGPPHGVGLQAHLFIGGGQEFVYFVSLHVCFGDAWSGIAFRRRAALLFMVLREGMAPRAFKVNRLFRSPSDFVRCDKGMR